MGVLLLKPTIALPFVVLLLVRREWKACGVVAVCAVVWYLGSVAASAGDWNWIPPYLAIVHSLYNTDLGALYNGITLPMILVRLGISTIDRPGGRRDRIRGLPSRVIAREHSFRHSASRHFCPSR